MHVKMDCGTQAKIKEGSREGRFLDFCRRWAPQDSFTRS